MDAVRKSCKRSYMQIYAVKNWNTFPNIIITCLLLDHLYKLHLCLYGSTNMSNVSNFITPYVVFKRHTQNWQSWRNSQHCVRFLDVLQAEQFSFTIMKMMIIEGWRWSVWIQQRYKCGQYFLIIKILLASSQYCTFADYLSTKVHCKYLQTY